MSSHQRSGWVALLLFATLPLALRASQPDAPKPSLETLDRDLRELNKQLSLLDQRGREELRSLNEKFKTLEQSVSVLVNSLQILTKEQQRVSAYFTPTQNPGNGSGSVEEGVRIGLEDRVRKLEQELNALRIRVRALEGGLSQPLPSVPASAIILENQLSVPITVQIDSSTYRIQPGSSRRVPRQAGTFTYQVWADGYLSPIQPLTTRTLGTGAEYRIYAY